MSLARRKALVAVSQQYDVPILEDDCYVDLRYDGDDVPALYALDGTGHVMYVASFSKIIAPGMRLGYMTAPRPVLERAIAAKSGGSVNTFAAFAVHRYSTGQLHSHIEEICDIQRAKRDAMLAALAEHFGDGATWSQPQGGLYIWVKLPRGRGRGAHPRQGVGERRRGLSDRPHVCRRRCVRAQLSAPLLRVQHAGRDPGGHRPSGARAL